MRKELMFLDMEEWKTEKIRELIEFFTAKEEQVDRELERLEQEQKPLQMEEDRLREESYKLSDLLNMLEEELEAREQPKAL